MCASGSGTQKIDTSVLSIATIVFVKEHRVLKTGSAQERMPPTPQNIPILLQIHYQLKSKNIPIQEKLINVCTLLLKMLLAFLVVRKKNK